MANTVVRMPAKRPASNPASRTTQSRCRPAQGNASKPKANRGCQPQTQPQTRNSIRAGRNRKPFRARLSDNPRSIRRRVDAAEHARGLARPRRIEQRVLRLIIDVVAEADPPQPMLRERLAVVQRELAEIL